MNCKFCGKEFYVERGDTRRLFCSRKCYLDDLKVNKRTYVKKGTYKKCEFCDKKFYVYPSTSDQRFCSHNCYFKSRNTETWKHYREIKQQVKNLTNQGFKCFLPDYKPRPDIIATKDGKVYAVEIDFKLEPDFDKYKGITFYDDIFWILIRNGKKEVKKQDGT